MALNPQIEMLLGLMAQLPQADYETITPQVMREGRMMPPLENPTPVAEVRDPSLDLPGRTIAARLYRAEGAPSPAPLVLFYHGGGWVVGSVDSHDELARALCAASGAAVLSVEYRLSPETPFPGPLDDCHDALLWAVAHAADLGIDPARLAVAGDSAGGNLAAAVALRLRDAKGPALVHQLLIYPVTDADFTRPSFVENAEGYFLTTRAMQWFWNHYLGDCSDPHPEAAVLRHPDLSGLPPATVIVAHFDPLRDEGLAYAEALQAAGVPVEVETAPDMIHGFFSMAPMVPDAAPYIARAGARLKAAFASG
ncbi:MAG: chloramphenicol hydrolase [Novosphingobium sp.]